MKTGNFALLRNSQLIENGVSIALGNCKYYTVKYKMKELAPSWDLLNKFRQELITEEDYVRIYNEQLSKLNAKVIYSRLMQMTGGKEPILMCHCGKEYFCHRHLVAEWFKKELGISVTEYNCKDKIAKDGRLVEKCTTVAQQMTIF